jgi:Glycosyltransferase family 87
MRTKSSSWKKDAQRVGIFQVGLTAILSVLGLGLLFYANLRFAEASPGGNDFLVHWVGGRYILRGKDPYSDEAAREIQTIVYGRPAAEGEHQLRVAYPYYGELLFLPLSLIGSYPAARAVWMVLLEVAQMGLALTTLASFGVFSVRWLKVVFLVFSLSWYFGARALINGNAVILVGLCITTSAWLLKKNTHGILAGILLALATIKPQVAFFPMLVLLLISFNRKRYRFLCGFLGAMAVFSLLSFFLLPTWIREFALEVIRYPSYNPPYAPAAILGSEFGNIGSAIGWGISILALFGLALLFWKSQNLKGEDGLMMLVGLVMTLSFLSGIPNDPGNEAILVLPIAGIFLRNWTGRRRMEIIPWGIFLLLIWIGLWAFFLMTIEWTGQPVQSPMILFPLPAILLAGWCIQYAYSNPAVAKES